MKEDPETYTEAETIAGREAALKRAFAMPHKPHKPKDVKPLKPVRILRKRKAPDV